ncbi:hypothetical protein JCM10212_005620 [Sporobolomyces blumeae]
MASATPVPLSQAPLRLQLLDLTIPVLRLTQSLSACSFSFFALVHVSAPLSALLPSRPKYLSSAENRANGVLLIGRELYQGEWTEPIVVYGSLVVHVVSGVASRGLKVLQRRERRKWKREELNAEMRKALLADPTLATTPTSSGATEDLPAHLSEGEQELVVDELDQLEAQVEHVAELDERTGDVIEKDEIVVPSASCATARSSSLSASSTWPILTTHHLMGYALIPLVTHHLWLHRLVPSSPLPPISSLSPSFFNYTFTAHSLTHPSTLVRTLSTVAYASLASIATYHALVGWRLLLFPTAPRSLAPSRPRSDRPLSRRRRVTKGREWQAGWCALVVGLGVGTARIAGRLGGERIVGTGGKVGGTPDWILKRMDVVLRRGFFLSSA